MKVYVFQKDHCWDFTGDSLSELYEERGLPSPTFCHISGARPWRSGGVSQNNILVRMDISVRTLPTNAKKCSTPKVFMIITFAPDRDNQAVTALAAARRKARMENIFALTEIITTFSFCATLPKFSSRIQDVVMKFIFCQLIII